MRNPRSCSRSYQDIIDASRLPPAIRPCAYAFGTLADGFPPIETVCGYGYGSGSGSADDAAGGAEAGGGQGEAGGAEAGGATADGADGLRRPLSNSSDTSSSDLDGDAAAAAAAAGDCSRGSDDCGSGQQLEVKLCSVVMKAVQVTTGRSSVRGVLGGGSADDARFRVAGTAAAARG